MIRLARPGARLKPRPALLPRPRNAGCEVSLRLRSPLPLIALLGFLFWQVVRPNPFAATGIAFIGSLLLIGFVWAWAMAAGVTTHRMVRFTALQVGDHLDETLSLQNRTRLPVVFAEFIDHSTLPGYAIDGVRAGPARATRSWRLDTVCRQRGIFSLGRWDVRLGDPFGIFEVDQRYRLPGEITVLPAIADLSATLSRHRTLGDRTVLRQPLQADTVNALTARPYLPGDSLRRIHWRTTARRGELFIRTFEPEALSPTWLLPDLDPDVQIGSGPESSLEKLIMVAAGLVSELTEQGIPVGLLLPTPEATLLPPPARSGDRWSLLRALAAAEASGTSLASTLGRVQRLVGLRDSLAILTPSLDPSWLQVLPPAVAAALGRVEVWLLDPSSFGGPGDVRVVTETLRRQGVPVHVLRSRDIRPRSGAGSRVRRGGLPALSPGSPRDRRTPRSTRTVSGRP